MRSKAGGKMNKKILEIKNLSYRYNQSEGNALNNISFDVNEGEFFCIIGANGSGKSTLCNALVGLIPHYFVGHLQGEILLNGKSVSDYSIGELSSLTGLVFQNPFNQLSYTADTVAEELAYGLGNQGIAQEEMVGKVQQVAELMRLNELLDKNPLELSGGQVQRVAFGSTYILEPKILVLDECTTQLDPIGSEEIMSIVKKLKTQGITIIMVDHDMERVAEYADRVLVLKEGKVCQVDTPREIFSQADIEQYQIAVPDYVGLSQALLAAGYSIDSLAMTEAESIQQVKEVLENED